MHLLLPQILLRLHPKPPPPLPHPILPLTLLPRPGQHVLVDEFIFLPILHTTCKTLGGSYVVNIVHQHTSSQTPDYRLFENSHDVCDFMLVYTIITLVVLYTSLMYILPSAPSSCATPCAPPRVISLLEHSLSHTFPINSRALASTVGRQSICTKGFLDLLARAQS